MKAIRMLKMSIRDSFKSVIRNYKLSLASISCITITLIVVAISIVLSYNVEQMTRHVSSNISIVVFLKSETTEEQVKQVKNNILALDNIADVTYKSKKEYAKETKEMDPRFALIVDNWTDETNPLLDSYEVKVKDIYNFRMTKSFKTFEKIN